MNPWDVIIIGGGPAGLSASLMLGRSRRRVLVLDDARPRNRFARHMHGVLGHEGVPPEDLAARGREEAARYGVEFALDPVARVADGDRDIEVGTASGMRHRARALILATGLDDVLPEVPGLAERWGTTVLHCPYCHGWEVRDRRLGVLLTSRAGVHQAQLARQLSDTVTVFTQGVDLDAAERGRLQARGVTLIDSRVVELSGDATELAGARTADGRTHPLDAVFTAAMLRPRDEMLADLPLARQDDPNGAFLAVDAMHRTSHPRVWATGNVVLPYATVPLSMGDGAMTGGAVNAALVAEDFDRAVADHAQDA
jgi:thioredoxin reductase